MTDTKINPHAEIHAKATKRTPSRLYPQDQMIAANEADDGYHRDIEYAMESLIADYESKHGTLLPDGWTPAVYWHGVKKVELPFDADEWAAIILEDCNLPSSVEDASELAGRIIERYYESAYEDWDEGFNYSQEVEQALLPALAYVERFDEFSDRAELARLLAPAGEIANKWFLGYEEDSDHAIDIEPEHLRAELAKWRKGVRWEDLVDEEPHP
jgi:hypothetical protein